MHRYWLFLDMVPTLLQEWLCRSVFFFGLDCRFNQSNILTQYIYFYSSMAFGYFKQAPSLALLLLVCGWNVHLVYLFLNVF